MADVTWDAMVWNHAIVAFETRILARGKPSLFRYEPTRGIPAEHLDARDIFITDDNFMTAEQAVKYGLIDKVI